MLNNVVFKRKFAMSMYKNRKLLLGKMTFYKDFVTDKRGDLYPIIKKGNETQEKVFENRYYVTGYIERLIGQFFPFASYEITIEKLDGQCGFHFNLGEINATVLLSNKELTFTVGEKTTALSLPDWVIQPTSIIVSCRPQNFDVYFIKNDQPQYFHTFISEEFINSNHIDSFSNGFVTLCVNNNAIVKEVSYYIDCGISQADIRPIRYENGDVLIEQGKIYLSATIRMQEEMFQGVFTWVPGTALIELTGALFYDSGDGKWCGDVASSILYHRETKMWYLWVCSFSHDHILGHAAFPGDPRFGVNVIDIELMKKSPSVTPISVFTGMEGDEDPDFIYDEQTSSWFMAICRLDTSLKAYRYVFFCSDNPFDGYTYIGQGVDGAETGGSFVRIKDELHFACGNSFNSISDYRIYDKNGMQNVVFDYPDGGFRGWGTIIPVKQGSRIRHYWLTFDRHKASQYNWSYGNLYCFEAKI